jgi:hypothetical protein
MWRRHDRASPDCRASRRGTHRRVGVNWRVGGIAMIFLAAIVLVSARTQNLDMHAPLMIAGFAILALGWILAFIGIFVRTRYHARRLRE